MITGKLQRASLLHDHHRNEEAIALLNEVLAEMPDCDAAHYQKAWCLLDMPGRKKEALTAIESAIAIEPNEPIYLSAKSVVLSQLDRDKEALVLAEEAIQLDPDYAGAWISKAQALGGMSRWVEAEDAIRNALEIDPDDTVAANLLTLYLRMQNRLDHSDNEVKRRLAKDAEDPFTHANAGWVALQRSDHKQAEEHFRESLRIDPEMEYARSGLLESYKARSLFYRIFLKWVFFLQKYSEKNQLIIVIAIYVGYRFARGFLDAVHPVLGAIVVVAYLIFVFGSWIASGIGHFIILKDPLARLALNRREKCDGWAVGGVFCLGLVLIIIGVVFRPLELAIAGGMLIGSTIPASRVFLNRSRAGKFIFSAITLAIYLCAIVYAVTANGSTIGIAAILAFGSTWLSMIPSLYRGDE